MRRLRSSGEVEIARLTAFMLARDRLPPELDVLVGSSPTMTRWGLW